jgi:hypothetical protein
VSIQADEWDLLDAILRRLKDRVDWANDGTAFLSDEPIPLQIPPGNRVLTVCLGAGQYDQPTYLGAGPNGLAEQVTVLVTIINQCALDSPPQFNAALLHQGRGLLKPHKADVLRALLVSDSQHCEGHVDMWVPTLEGEHFLRERGLIPRNWSAPQVIQADVSYLVTTLELLAAFDQSSLFS